MPLHWVRARVFISLLGLTVLLCTALLYYNGDSGAPGASLFAPSTATMPSRRKVILMWTPAFNEEKPFLGDDCPLRDRCELTYAKSRLSEADALVFHVPDINFHHWPNETALHGKRVPKVFFTQETAPNLFKYWQAAKLPKRYFHWTMTYLRNSTIPMPYGGTWLSPAMAKSLNISADRLDYDSVALMTEKRHPVVFWLVSNCITDSKREKAIDELAKYIRVDIAGKCAKNESMRKACPGNSGTHPCDEVFNKYPFHFEGENSICRDYITEKYWARYQLNSIPIVMNKDIYEGVVPNGSFIAMSDFAGPQALAQHLHHLIDHPLEYVKYFEWRRAGWARAPWNHAGYRNGFCRLCEKLVEEDAEQWDLTPIPDVGEWYTQACNCDSGQFVDKWLARAR